MMSFPATSSLAGNSQKIKAALAQLKFQNSQLAQQLQYRDAATRLAHLTDQFLKQLESPAKEIFAKWDASTQALQLATLLGDLTFVGENLQASRINHLKERAASRYNFLDPNDLPYDASPLFISIQQNDLSMVIDLCRRGADLMSTILFSSCKEVLNAFQFATRCQKNKVLLPGAPHSVISGFLLKIQDCDTQAFNFVTPNFNPTVLPREVLQSYLRGAEPTKQYLGGLISWQSMGVQLKIGQVFTINKQEGATRRYFVLRKQSTTQGSIHPTPDTASPYLVDVTPEIFSPSLLRPQMPRMANAAASVFP